MKNRDRGGKSDRQKTRQDRRASGIDQVKQICDDLFPQGATSPLPGTPSLTPIHRVGTTQGADPHASSVPKMYVYLYHYLKCPGPNGNEVRIICLQLENHWVQDGRNLCSPRYIHTGIHSIADDPLSLQPQLECMTRGLGYDQIGSYKVAHDYRSNKSRFVHVVHTGGSIRAAGLASVFEHPFAPPSASHHRILTLTPGVITEQMFRGNLGALKRVFRWLIENGYDTNDSIRAGLNKLNQSVQL